MYRLFLFLFLPIFLLSKDFIVATYNVENLFDLNYDKTEYNEFIPNKTNWNKKILDKKTKNIAKVINSIDANIIALQEIESKKALEMLLKKTPQYKYYNFLKNPRSSVGVAILSKFKIIETKSINIKSNSKIERPIQKVVIEIENGKNITIFNNHWRSKRASESKRIAYAQSLQNYLKNLGKSVDYILVGDFNSNYDEFETFKYNKDLNDSYNITGINQVLNTTIKNNYITKDNILNHNKKVHYNLWLELPYENRFSYFYKNSKNTPDNIIISPALFDGKNISYIENSFEVFKPNYLINGKKINRWQMNKNYHKGEGYSDHLPVFARFSTNPSNKIETKTKKENKNSISYLYTINSLNDDTIKIDDVLVLYKQNNSAIIKQKNNRAIFVFNSANNLEINKRYNIEVEEIKNHYGLKEITKLRVIKKLKDGTKDINSNYLDGSKVDIFDISNQNEIISNLKGVFQNGYLYYGNTKIKIYAKNKEILPKNGEEITIKSAHLGYFKTNPQLIIYKKSDYSVN